MVNGFSKSHSMTGWRMGYAAGPKEIISLMTKLHQFAIMSAPTMSQYAAIEAMKNGDDDIEYMRGQYDMRRRLIVDGLNNMGLKCFEPEGAFYVFPSVKSTGLTSMEFCERLIRSHRVAVVPGDAEERELSVLDDRFLSSPSLALERAHDAVVQMSEFARDNYRLAVELIWKFDAKKLERLNETEVALDKLEGLLDN